MLWLRALPFSNHFLFLAVVQVEGISTRVVRLQHSLVSRESLRMKQQEVVKILDQPKNSELALTGGGYAQTHSSLDAGWQNRVRIPS